MWDRPNFLARGISQLDVCAVEQDEDESSEEDIGVNNARDGSGGSAHDCSGHNTRPNSADGDPQAPPLASAGMVGGGGDVFINARYERLPFLLFSPQKIQVENRTRSGLDLFVLDDEIREAVLYLL